MGTTNQSVQHQVKHIELNLNKISKHLNQSVEETVRKISKDLEEETIKRVPVDSGNLEESIDVNYLMVNGEYQAKIFIGSKAPYAIYLHEGEYNLGKKSRRKQLSQTVTVGRKFMERAFNENKQKYIRWIKRYLKKALGGNYV